MSMELLLWVMALVAALAILAKAADVFMTAAEQIGLSAGLPPFVIGISIVAFGTSLPELVASVLAVIRGSSEIAIGTVVGSNITNILLILGLSAVLGRGMTVAYELVRVDLPFLFGSALALTMFAWNGQVAPVEGAISLAAASIYIAYAVSTADAPTTIVATTASKAVPEELAASSPKTWATLVVTAGLIHLSAHVTVESVVAISSSLGIATEVLSASVVAIGTSLPELVVSGRAALAGKPEIAAGNIIGSNIFNALGVVGVAALFGGLTVPPLIVTFMLPTMLGVTVLCFFVLQEREMTRWDGWLLMVLYAGFLVQLYGLG